MNDKTIANLVVDNKSDEQHAADLRERARPVLESLVKIMDDARRLGLQMDFAIARDQFGRPAVQGVSITKPL